LPADLRPLVNLPEIDAIVETPRLRPDRVAWVVAAGIAKDWRGERDRSDRDDLGQ
jgi:hypothetical protein